MLLLTLFAFLAGLGTALSPCSLPVLPALLSASATGGRRRPLGIVIGLALTFTVTIVGLAEVVDGVGLGSGFLRGFAIAALLVFGIAVAVPRIGHVLERPLAGLSRLAPRSGGDGFVSGLGVGGALGFVHAPCAGPVLAAVIAVSATTGKTIVLGIAFSAGTAVTLFFIAITGRRYVGRLTAKGRTQTVLGGVMVLTAVLMAFSVDIRFQQAIADDLPGFVTNPTKALEESGAVKDRLADVRGTSRFEEAQSAAPSNASTKEGVTADLPQLGAAPEITGTQKWFNGAPNTIAANVAAGKVTLIDFWTYTCINCVRTIPYLRAWDERYRDAGLSIIGVHAPEFAFEKKASNVESAIDNLKIGYPVVQDNEMATWNAWQNQYWPAKYLIDAKGQVRYVHFGEGEDDETEAAIRGLLAEAGAAERLGAKAEPEGVVKAGEVATPETYFGSLRAQGWTTRLRDGTRTYRAPAELALNEFALSGRWRVDGESATALSKGRVRGRFNAKVVYIVLVPPEGRPGRVEVRLDGRRRKSVRVDRQELFTLLELPEAGEHELDLRVSDGTGAFAFTFG